MPLGNATVSSQNWVQPCDASLRRERVDGAGIRDAAKRAGQPGTLAKWL